MVEYHLVVLVHGLWGNSSHMQHLKSQIEQNARADDTELVCYVTGSHSGFLTYDGIDVNGKRICDEILAETARLLQEKDKVTKLSIVGYSLGGLISRYAVGYLYSIDYFEDVQPVNFTTFCTPHVGALNPGNSWGTRLYNYWAPLFLAHTGSQLFLSDGKKDRKPLLVWMSDPKSIFFKALTSFSNLALYANVVNDKRTSWYTSAISTRDPFKSMMNENASAYALEFIKGYAPNVVDISKPITFKEEIDDKVDRHLDRGKKSLLRKFNWIKVVLGVTILSPFWLCYFVGLTIFQRISNQRRVSSFFREASNSLMHLYEDVTGEVHEEKTTTEETPTADDASEETIFKNFERDISDRVYDQTDELVESIFTAMNSDSYKYYHANVRKSLSPSDGEEILNLRGKEQDFNLPLVDSQLTIINNLNKLPWQKYPVLIRKTKQTHRAAIYRVDDPSFEEGKAVVSHFTREVFQY